MVVLVVVVVVVDCTEGTEDIDCIVVVGCSMVVVVVVDVGKMLIWLSHVWFP